MAASTVVPTRTARPHRALAAGAAARIAPRGPGLAPVVVLPVRRDGGVAAATGALAPAIAVPSSEPVGTDRRPELRLVAPAARTGRSVRRRTVAILVTIALVVAGAGLAASALAMPADPPVGGHVVLQPGETLWDIAVRSAPNGTDPRTQLDTLRRLNGLGAGALDAWTVVLLPAV
jgi:hypothetical protein